MQVDLTGQTFGRLTVIAATGTKHRNGGVQWLCRCTCGAEHVSVTGVLRNGNVRSCGCLSRDNTRKRSVTHGHFGSPTYISWTAMRSRCRNPRHHAWKNYGGRGITVCARWDRFENFLEDMGERPDGSSIDRIDHERGYEVGNCRWSDNNTQARNRRTIKLDAACATQIRWLHADGGYSRSEIAKAFGIVPAHVGQIIKRRNWGDVP